MTPRRRRILQLLAIGTMLPAFRRWAKPPRYPSRPVRIVVGFPAGGPLDIVARIVAPWLTPRLGQPFAVENVAGESGNRATALVATAAPDGHVLLLCGPVQAINATLYEGRDFNFSRDIVPVAGIARVPLVVEVHPSVPARTAAALIAFARSNPARLRVAYAGTGTPQHIAIEQFRQLSRADVTLVAYPGSAAALADLLAGKVDAMFDPLPSSLPHIHAGRLVPLAVTGREPAAALPGVPVLGEVLPGYEAGSWFGIGAPRGTPAAIVAVLNAAIDAGLADPDLIARLAQAGAVPMPGTPADFAGFVATETARYCRIISLANITAK